MPFHGIGELQLFIRCMDNPTTMAPPKRFPTTAADWLNHMRPIVEGAPYMSPVEIKNTSVHTRLSVWADDRKACKLTVSYTMLETTDNEDHDRDPEGQELPGRVGACGKHGDGNANHDVCTNCSQEKNTPSYSETLSLDSGISGLGYIPCPIVLPTTTASIHCLEDASPKSPLR